MWPILALGIKSSIPSTIPRPALKTGTIAISSPDSVLPVVLAIGVSISISFRGRLLVTSYAMSMDISLTNSLKSFGGVFLSLSIVNLC